MLFWAPELCSAFSSVTIEYFLCSSFHRFLWQFDSCGSVFVTSSLFLIQYLFIICECEQVFIHKHACHWHVWDHGLTCRIQESDSGLVASAFTPLSHLASSKSFIKAFLLSLRRSFASLAKFICSNFVCFFLCLFAYSLFIWKTFVNGVGS